MTKKDILGFIESGGQAQQPAAPAEAAAAPAEAPAAPQDSTSGSRAAPARAGSPGSAAPKAPAAPVEAGVGEQVEPMTAMRSGIAEHMRRSLDTSAHVTSAIEVDMSRVVALREKLKPEFQKSYGVNPTYLHLRRAGRRRDPARVPVDQRRDARRQDRHPQLRQPRLRGRARRRQGPDRPRGQERREPEPARHGPRRRPTSPSAPATSSCTPDEVQGGTFTITNPGGYGTFHGTPVISQPQAAILGTYALVKRPWVVQDELGKDVIAIRPIMNLTLTYDHRLVDGALAGRFLHDAAREARELGRVRLLAAEHGLRLRDLGAPGVRRASRSSVSTDDRRPALVEDTRCRVDVAARHGAEEVRLRLDRRGRGGALGEVEERAQPAGRSPRGPSARRRAGSRPPCSGSRPRRAARAPPRASR